MKRALVAVVLVSAFAACDFDAALQKYRANAASLDAGAADAGERDAGGPGDAGGDDAGLADAGVSDAGASDAGDDAGLADAGSGDAGQTDGGPGDAGVGDGGAGDAGSSDAGMLDCTLTSAQLRQVRALADGGPISSLPLPIVRVPVTATRAAGSVSEPEGFFVQCQAAGPALFVVAPPDAGALFGDGGYLAANGVSLGAGSLVSLSIQAVAPRAQLVEVVTAQLGLPPVVHGQVDVRPLITDVTLEDLVTDAGRADDFESRLVSVTGTVANVFPTSGFQNYRLTTPGLSDGGVAVEVRTSADVASRAGMIAGCTARVGSGPMWRHLASSQILVNSMTQLAGTTCPSLTVMSAVAVRSNGVRATFSRALQPVDAGAFSISPALAISGATLLDSGVAVELQTATQQPLSYSLSVDGGLRDVFGAPVIASGTFAGYVALCPPPVVINQIYAAGGGSGAVLTHDFVELRNTTASPINLSGWSLTYASASGLFQSGTGLAVTVPARGYLLVQLASGGTNGVALPTADQSNTTVNLSVSSGKLALSSAPLPAGVDCAGAKDAGVVVDLVAWGIASCGEGAARAPSTSATQALVRTDCLDRNEDSLDFTLASPDPHNSASPPSTCTCP